MMTELHKKKYFIMDTSVNGIDNDLFNYTDISKVGCAHNPIILDRKTRAAHSG